MALKLDFGECKCALASCPYPADAIESGLPLCKSCFDLGHKAKDIYLLPDEEPSQEPGGVKSSANLADLHMHGLTYFRGAHCSGQQSQHQQVALTDVRKG